MPISLAMLPQFAATLGIKLLQYINSVNVVTGIRNIYVHVNDWCNMASPKECFANVL